MKMLQAGTALAVAGTILLPTGWAPSSAATLTKAAARKLNVSSHHQRPALRWLDGRGVRRHRQRDHHRSATLLSTAVKAPAPAPKSTPTAWAQGSTHGVWTVNYNGYGSVWHHGGVHLSPKASTRASETHAALVTSVGSYRDVDTTVGVTTVKQLRTGTQPNAWECAWVLWNHVDDAHFYYVVLKPNGFELGKADPAYPGAQRFLVTLDSPRFPIGSTHVVHVRQSGPTMSVWVDGILMTTFTDNERPYEAGHVGLYDEDSHALFTPLRTVSQV